MNNLIINYPEMHGEIENDIQAEFTCIGSKPYRVKSKSILPLTRGIEYNGVIGEFGANNTPNKKAGWHKYYMTENAFKKLHQNNKVVLNCLL